MPWVCLTSTIYGLELAIQVAYTCLHVMTFFPCEDVVFECLIIGVCSNAGFKHFTTYSKSTV